MKNTITKTIRVGRFTFSFRANLEVAPKPGEFYGNLHTIKTFERDGQRWDLCRNDKTESQEWVHGNCDSTCINGTCLMCGAEVPTIW